LTMQILKRENISKRNTSSYKRRNREWIYGHAHTQQARDKIKIE